MRSGTVRQREVDVCGQPPGGGTTLHRPSTHHVGDRYQCPSVTREISLEPADPRETSSMSVSPGNISAGIFILGLFFTTVQATFILSPLHSVYSDMNSYVERAERFASGAAPTPFDFFFPPGTSYFYALAFAVFPRLVALKLLALLQCMFLALAPVLLFRTVDLLFNRRIAVFSGVAAAFYWPLIARASFFLSEPLFIVLVLGAQYVVARACVTDGREKGLMFSGLLLGAATITRSQGICFFIPLLFFLLLDRAHRNSFRDRFRSAILLTFPFVAVLGAQMLVNRAVFTRSMSEETAMKSDSSSPVSTKVGYFLSANDTYNLFLGQSRRQGVGAFDAATGMFHVFYNDNSVTPYLFHPPVVVPTSILNREYFSGEVRRLWHRDSKLQLFRSLENLIELWSVRASWPVSIVPKGASIELGFAWLAAILVSLPAAIGFLSVLLAGEGRRPWLFFAPPLVFLTASSFVSTGQPRFLLPFLYNLFPLATIVWLSIFGRERQPAGAHRMISAGVVCAALFGSMLAMRSYAATVPPRIDGDESRFVTLAGVVPEPDTVGARSAGALVRFRFGADGNLFDFDPPVRSGNGNTVPKSIDADRIGYSISGEGFAIGEGWPDRAVSSFVESRDGGVLRFRFPPGRVTHIALYAADGDSFERAFVLRSGHDEVIAQDLHNGRWLSFPLTPEEQRKGEKFVIAARLLGRSITLGGAILYRAANTDELADKDMDKELQNGLGGTNHR